MAQISSTKNFSTPRRLLSLTNLAVAVPAAGNTTLATIQVSGVDRIFAQFVLTGFAFDVFRISAKPHTDAAMSLFYSAAAAFTGPQGLIVGASGDLTTLAAASTGWFIMDTRGLESVLVEASANGGTAAVDVYIGGA